MPVAAEKNCVKQCANAYALLHINIIHILYYYYYFIKFVIPYPYFDRMLQLKLQRLGKECGQCFSFIAIGPAQFENDIVAGET